MKPRHLADRSQQMRDLRRLDLNGALRQTFALPVEDTPRPVRIDEHPVFLLLDNRRFSFADVCKLRDDYPALCAGELPCPKLSKRNPRSQKPIGPTRGICRLSLGRKYASSRLCRERHTTARLESWTLSQPF